MTSLRAVLLTIIYYQLNTYNLEGKMAICRCHNCGKPTQHVTEEYVESVHPVGYPNTAAICGNKWCNIPGMIWLTKIELEEYQNKGRRIFDLHTDAIKVKTI
jgi:hypothetical protein